MIVRILLPILCSTGALAAAALAEIPPDSVATPTRPKWALALSGGLARGIAHVGVLRALEEEGIRPDVVVGTSMGALVGALWVSGRSSRDIQALFASVNAQSLFEPHPSGFEWRQIVTPRPWLTLWDGGRPIAFPPAMLDDAYLNYLLSRHLLLSDAVAQGNFDRFTPPLRVVATSLADLTPVVLRRGSVAQAVRSSVALPVVFPAIELEEKLLTDGGISSHLPLAAAQATGARHVLAIDVAAEVPRLEETSSALRVFMNFMELVARGGKTAIREDVDRLVWLKMKGISSADFRLADTLVAIGYRESRGVVARVAREWSLSRAAGPDTTPVLPPLGSVEWIDADGKPARRAGAATRALGTRPSGPLGPDDLAAGLERVFLADLFSRAWPRFGTERGSTRLTFQVREHHPLDLSLAGGFSSDTRERVNAALLVRPYGGPLPARVVVGGTYRRFGRQAYASMEPRSLHRGATGVFLRGGARRTDVRLFDGAREMHPEKVERAELVAGGQTRLPTGDMLQAGGGVGRVWAQGRTWEGPLAALRLESSGRVKRLLEASAVAGSDRFASARAGLSWEIHRALATLRTSVAGGWASEDAPLDEMSGVGGPSSLAGLRRDEWLGRRKLALELRLLRWIVTGVDLHAFGHAARVDDAVSRPDLSGRFRFGGGLGVLANVPFGPVTLDWGISERGAYRLEVSVGQEF